MSESRLTPLSVETVRDSLHGLLQASSKLTVMRAEQLIDSVNPQTFTFLPSTLRHRPAFLGFHTSGAALASQEPCRADWLVSRQL